MTGKRSPKTDPATLAQVNQRVEDYLAQREKIRDGGDTIIAANGCELLLSDLQALASEVRHLLQNQPKPAVEVGEAMVDVAMDAYRQCRNTNEPSDARWVEEALMAARTMADPSLAKLTPRQVVPDEMLHQAMDAYRTARNAGLTSERKWVRAALVCAQTYAQTMEPVSSEPAAQTRKRTP